MNYINVYLLLSHIAFIYGMYFGAFCIKINTNFIIFLLLLTILSIKKRFLFGTLLIFLSFLIGISAFNLFNSQFNPTSNDEYISDQIQTYKGIVETYPRFLSNRTQILVKTNSIICNNLELSFNKRTLLFVNGIMGVKKGDSVIFQAKLKSVIDQKVEGIKSYSDYLINSGINYTANIYRISQITILQNGSIIHSYISDLRREMHFFLKENDNYGVTEALLLGEKDSLSDDFKYNIIRTQLMHIFVVSGLHIALLFFFFIYLIDFIIKFFPSLISTYTFKRISYAVSALLITPYMMLLDFQPCATRAYIQCIIYAFSILAERRISLVNSLLISSIIQTTIDPTLVFNASFILSYISVLSIALIGTPLTKKLIIKDENRFEDGNRVGAGLAPALLLIKKSILSTLIMTVSVSFGLTPILINYFGFISLWSPLFNLIVVPYASFLLTPLSMVFGLLFIISKEMAGLLVPPMKFLTYFMDKLTSVITYFPYGDGIYFSLDFILILYSFIFAIYLTVTSRKYVFILLIPIVMSVLVYSEKDDFRLKLLVLNSKYEQFIFIKNGSTNYGSGQKILFIKKQNKKVNPILTSYLVSKERAQIDYLIVPTINEKNINYLIDKIRIKNLYVTERNKKVSEKINQKLINKKIKIEYMMDSDFKIEGLSLYKYDNQIKIKDNRDEFDIFYINFNRIDDKPREIFIK